MWIWLWICPHSSHSKHMPEAAQVGFDVTFVLLHLRVTGPAGLTGLVCLWLPIFPLQNEIRQAPLQLPTGNHGHQTPACWVYSRFVCYTCTTFIQNSDRISYIYWSCAVLTPASALSKLLDRNWKSYNISSWKKPTRIIESNSWLYTGPPQNQNKSIYPTYSEASGKGMGDIPQHS